MSVAVKAMDWQDVIPLQNMLAESFVNGQCYELAIGLNRALGWDIYAVYSAGTITHAFVRAPTRSMRFLHGAGFEDPELLLEMFDWSGEGYIDRVTSEDLAAIRPIEEHSVELGIKLAQQVWPLLPWQSGTRERFQAFGLALAQLCKEHGVWLRGEVPASPPIAYLTDGDGGEEGFDITPFGLGDQVFIERVFE